jgi:monoamine oxidase
MPSDLACPDGSIFDQEVGMRAARSKAVSALGVATRASAHARSTGCSIEEASATIAEALVAGCAAGKPTSVIDGWSVTRRGFLGGLAGAGLAVAGVPEWLRQSARPEAPAGTSSVGTVAIIGSGIAGLGCAYRLWHEHGIASSVYEYNAERAGGRLYTLRDYFDDGQYAEEHAEFISSEHTVTRQLAQSFGLTLDNVNAYPARTRPDQYQLRFGASNWSQAALNAEWHEWAWKLFKDAAFKYAPWPTTYSQGSKWARRWDNMSGAEWIQQYVHGGIDSDFGQLCVAVLLDEYGGPVDEQSALNLVYLLGMYDSSASGVQPKGSPELSGTDEKWHIRGGNDQLISGLLERIPKGTLHLGQELVSLSSLGHGRYQCTFADGATTSTVSADHVVLTLPFTRLRHVHLSGLGLPAAQKQAIADEPLGSNSKIQLQFSSRVWNADHWTGNLYTDNVLQGAWETTIDQRGPNGILVALPGGDEGANIGARYGLRSYYGPAPAGMVDDYLAGWEAFYPTIRSAYTGKAYYAWSSGDPHILGAYSYLKAGQYTAFNGIQGLRSGNVHFGGEHTSLNFQGFVEGALRSGYRCAAEVAGG